MDAPPSSASAPPANGTRSANAAAPNSEVPAFARLDAFAPLVHDAFPAQAPSGTYIAPNGSPSGVMDLNAIMGASRTKRLQTEKSHDARTGKTTKSKGKSDELSPADRDAYLHVGLDPHSLNDSAAEFRSKVQANVPKTLHYIISGERTSATLQKDTNNRLFEMAKLINEIKTSSERQSIVTDPEFIAVHNAVTENRNGIQQFANDLSTLRGVPAQLQTIQTELEALKSERRTNVPVFTPLTLPTAGTAAGGVAATNGHPVNMAGPGAVNIVPPATNVVPHTVNAAATTNQTGVLDHDHSGGHDHNVHVRPAKRPRTDNSDAIDVLFGPVQLSQEYTIQEVARASIELVIRKATHNQDRFTLAHSDVRTVFTVPRRSNMLSIRFKSADRALTFVSLVKCYPLMDGQDASLREGRSNLRPENETDGALEQILRGPSGSSSLRIAAWNIHGKLALKITDPFFVKLIKANDIVLFQETWMAEGEEHALPLPKGFSIVAKSRRHRAGLRRPHGGVAAVIRNTVSFDILTHLSAPDLIVLELRDVYVLCGYVLPAGSSDHLTWTNVDPEAKFGEAVATCGANGAKPVASMSDLNSRIAQRNTASSVLSRTSSDSTSNSRGTRLLGMCEQNHLEILNGTHIEGTSPGALTCFRPNDGGSSVVDYVLFSRAHLDMLRPGALKITSVSPELSDHSILSLTLDMPREFRTPLPAPLPPVPILRQPDTECDKLAAEAVSSARTSEEATKYLYGPVVSRGLRLQVHVAGSCRNAGRIDAKAALAVYWGGGNKYNVSYRVDGAQNEGRAVLAAIVLVLSKASENRALELSTTSKYAIRALSYWAGDNYTTGWPCANGDLLRIASSFIRNRGAPVHFIWNNPVEPNAVHTGARLMAASCLDNGGAAIFYAPPAPDWTYLDWPLSESEPPKVTASIAKEDPAKTKAVVRITADDLAIGDKPDAHRGRKKERELRSTNLNRLLNAQTPREWWDVLRGFTDSKPRDAQVTAAQLRDVFCGRLNPPEVMPVHFDADLKRLRDLMSASIPSVTTDTTPEQFFSRLFDIKDIEKVKKKLRTRSSKSARGLDKVSYAKISAIPNDVLVKLFNFCIAKHSGPQDWFITILIGILKLGKPGFNPDSYRLIGLECCLLKMLTLLIDIRIREWAEMYDILPDSQNGFREAYRTHNNSFILRCAIDRARAEGKTLFVAFVDLTNAFPSTDLPTLWIKLFNAGVAGPLFDWLRMLYARMSYVVRQGSELTAAFKSLIGVLTGDTASPTLWNVYFADLDRVFGPDADDILLAGLAVSHVEQADDVALFSTSFAGLQRKVNLFFGWCKVNFMVISVSKTNWMIFGELPRILPKLLVGDLPVELVKKYKFVGVWFTSITADIFSAHYTTKASKAENVANATFGAKTNIGTLPPLEGVRLYMARIDPHLIFGCEIMLDVVARQLGELTDVQHSYIRRLLRVHDHSMLAPLFTETGIVPLAFRRPMLALGYLIYLILLPITHLAHRAYLDSIALANAGSPSWLSDLRFVLASLPVPVAWPPGELSTDNVTDLRKDVLVACEKYLNNALLASAERLPLIQGRLERNSDGDFVNTALKFRQYLHVPVPAHRKALTRLLLSAHTLGIEILRYQSRYQRVRIPREWRLCRFCGNAIETESHALLQCRAHDLLAPLRRDFVKDLLDIAPDFPRIAHSADSLLISIVQCRDFAVIRRFAKFTYEVFEVYRSREVYKPAQYLYNPIMVD